MLASVDLPPEFRVLNQQFAGIVAELIDEVDLPPVRVETPPVNSGNFRHFDSGRFYLVCSGTISVRYRDRTLCLLQEGDFLLPDVTGSGDDEAAVYFGSEAGASLDSFSAMEFMQRVFASPRATKLWTRMLVTYSGMMLRLMAARTAADVVTTPGYEIYQPGDIIIHQGDRAEFVYNLSRGSAEVLVDGVAVGRVDEGEIFGAMAALTHSERTATVRARSTCSVVKVPAAQFTELIKTNPVTIHSLLADMANAIVSLNEQLVSLRGGETTA